MPAPMRQSSLMQWARASVAGHENRSPFTHLICRAGATKPPERAHRALVTGNWAARGGGFEFAQVFELTRATDPREGMTNPTRGITNPRDRTANQIHKITNQTHRMTNPIQGITNPLRRITNPIERITRPIHRITKPLHLLNKIIYKYHVPTQQVILQNQNSKG